MPKCEICKEKKARRNCPAIGKTICPSCCASKRLKEIDCPTDCEHLTSGQDFKERKDIEKVVRTGLYAMEKDISKDNKEVVLSLISEIESFLAEEFYENIDVNDHKIYNALSKVYAFYSGKLSDIKYDDEYEEKIIKKCFELEEKFKENLAIPQKQDILIRILDSIKKETGGTYSDKSYQRVIHIKNGGKVYF